MKKAIPLILILVCLTAAFWSFDFLPRIGDAGSKPNTHTTDYYIEHATTETNSPNMVTSVIVDYRAFDTMYETTVMFIAGVAALLILSNHPERKNRIRNYRVRKSRERTGSPVYRTVNKEVVITIIKPLILLYAIYVLFHGEVSLGGGFQAGALMGMTYILDVMVIPERGGFRLAKENSAALGGIGTFIYVLTGILCMVGGGVFLEYKDLPLPVEVLEKHSVGMLLVEIGVAICVMATIITILNAIMERVHFDDDTN